jgi:cell division protein FtsB
LSARHGATGKRRAKQKSAASLAALRNEVLTLQKDNRDLRKEMDDLKKKFDALLPTLPAAKTNQPPPARK